MINSLRNKEFAIGTRYSGGNSIDKDWPVKIIKSHLFSHLLLVIS